MIHLKPIKTKDAEYALAETLFVDAFPQEERRSLEKQRLVVDQNPCLELFALILDNEFAGFVSCWKGPDFVYVEHFATLPQVRGKGVGSEVLNLLAAKYEHPLVLEVELPQDEWAQRRIAFYQRNGFRLWTAFPYIQPPYQEHLKPIALHLMVRGERLNEAVDFERIKRWLYTEVYLCHDFNLTLPESGD